MENKMKEREFIVSHLKGELNKYYQNDCSSTKEIYIAEPERSNLELYNELNYSREYVSKVSRMLNTEKQKTEQLEEKIRDLEEKFQNLKKGKKIAQNMERISFLNYLSSDDDENEEFSDEDNVFLNLDSPVVKLPDKIKLPKLEDKNKTFSGGMNIPKLDLTVVKEKYHNPKNVEVAEVINFNKLTNRSTNEYVDKLKFQMKICKNTIKKLQKKLDKYKRGFEVQKTALVNMKHRNEILETELRKTNSTLFTCEEILKKETVNNTSMVSYTLHLTFNI
jgi:hypothetical protein